MEVGLNKVMLIGKLHRDPELRHAPSGQAVLACTVTTPRRWLDDKGLAHEETEWFSVVAWGSLAESAATRLSKGQQVYVEGRLHTRGWPDEDGHMQYRTEVVAHMLIALGESNQSDARQRQPAG